MLEIVILILATIAALADFITSRLRSPRLLIAGHRSKLYREEVARFKFKPFSPASLQRTITPGVPEELREEDVRVYQFALQSDESRPIEWAPAEAFMHISIRGAGSFLTPTLKAYLGPDEVRASWLSRHRTLGIYFDMMRPHKTWVFRCFVTADVEEMTFALYVPSRWAVRQFLMRLSRNLFSYSGPDLDESRIVVRQRETKTAPRNSLARLLIQATFGSVIYYLVVFQLFRFFNPTGDGPNLNRPDMWELPIVFVVLIIVLAILTHQSKRDPLPIAQGYQVGTLIPINDVQSKIFTDP